jgi:hypothetical protein
VNPNLLKVEARELATWVRACAREAEEGFDARLMRSPQLHSSKVRLAELAVGYKAGKCLEMPCVGRRFSVVPLP